MKARPVRYPYKIRLVSTVGGVPSPAEYGCEFRLLDGGFEVSYNDLATKTRNVIRVGSVGLNGGNRAEIERSGDYSGLIIVEPDADSMSRFNSPYGSTDISVHGTKVEFTVGEDSASAVIGYNFGAGDNLMTAEQSFTVEKA